MPWRFYTNEGIEKAGENLAYLFATGPAGPQGPANGTLSVGTVQTGTPGSNVLVTNSGSGSNGIFNFVIPAGRAATIDVGTVTTGTPGTAAVITNSGTTSAAVFNFTIPKGQKGDTGPPAAVDLLDAGHPDSNYGGMEAVDCGFI